jgi:hypothetical protein
LGGELFRSDKEIARLFITDRLADLIMRTRSGIILVCLLATFGALIAYRTLWSSPYMSLEVISANRDSMRFRIESRGINGIGSIRFYSQTLREDLWSVKIWSCHIDHFTYGMIPVCSPDSANARIVDNPVKQRIPADGKLPRKINIGEVFVVEIQYQHDDLFAPSMGTKKFAFRCISETEVSVLGVIND